MKEKKKYTCIIIDDEPIAIKVIQEHLSAFENIKCLKGYTKAIDALEILNQQKIDLIFLDINMPGVSGIEFLKTLSNPPGVIFTTAYRNFALDAFDLDAIDYLLKPISFERFLKSINKFFAAVSGAGNNKKNMAVDSKDYIILKSDKKNYKIKFDDLLYIESLDNYLKVYTSTLSIICYESLAHLEQELTPDFMRIHRSYIVNLSKVGVFTSSYVEIDEKRLTIGRNYKEQVAQKLKP